MPAYLEIINQPDPADLADLERIYAGYPLPPVASLADWLFDQRELGGTLIASRVGRELRAALWLHRAGDGRASLDHLSAVAGTSRDAALRQLLELLQQQAAQFQLRALRLPAIPAVQTLAPQLGFRADAEGWLWQQ